MRKAKIANLLMSMLLAALTAGAGADIYKWTDAQGRVHYSDSPPPNTQVEKLVVEEPSAAVPTAPVSAPATPTAEEWAERDRGFQERRAARAKAEAEAQEREIAQRDADRKLKCELARRNLDQILATRQRVVVAPDGAMQVSDDPPLNRFERARAIGEQEDLINTYCN